MDAYGKRAHYGVSDGKGGGSRQYRCGVAGTKKFCYNKALETVTELLQLIAKGVAYETEDEEGNPDSAFAVVLRLCGTGAYGAGTG